MEMAAAVEQRTSLTSLSKPPDMVTVSEKMPFQKLCPKTPWKLEVKMFKYPSLAIAGGKK
jgi:hypothetical protein